MTSERELLRQLKSDWPVPEPAAIQSSLALIERIQAAMAATGGSLGFDEFMAMALYEPGLGYYSGGMARFGAGGDFVTAPLISSLFSRTLARQAAQCLAVTGGMILELGAGTGQMAADVLTELASLDRLPEEYLILEVSGALRQQQRETLTARVPALAERVRWLDRLPERPLAGVVLANEVLDALPVKRFEVAAQGLQELKVKREQERFAWQHSPAPAALVQAVAAIEAELGEALPIGYQSEWCPQLKPWLASLADVLGQGVVFFIDYGYPRREYYHRQRAAGTLMCHYRHRAHDDPLILPGLQDITAFVDFSGVAEGALAAGFDVLGFAPQAQFLLGAGLLELMAQVNAEPGSREALLLAQQVKTLTLPGEMGERFKVLALGRDYSAPLAGFSLADQRGRL
jgi:SAM-dependent MidA family methyltransferase